MITATVDQDGKVAHVQMDPPEWGLVDEYAVRHCIPRVDALAILIKAALAMARAIINTPRNQ